MSADPKALYHEVIVEHGRQPRHVGLPQDESHRAEGDNPLCGDSIELAVALTDERLQAYGHRTRGCAVCVAAASAMGDAVLGKTLAEVTALAGHYAQLLDGAEAHPALGQLSAFGGAARFPMRRRCASLPWEVLLRALGVDQAADHSLLVPKTSSR